MEEQTKSEVDVLMGEPVVIKMFGKDYSVPRLTFTKQQEAVKIISEVFNSGSDSVSHMERISDLAVRIVCHATSIEKSEIVEKGNLVETLQAFRAIWVQNGFDFLSETVTDLTAKK